MYPQRAGPQVDGAVADVQEVWVSVEVFVVRRDGPVPACEATTPGPTRLQVDPLGQLFVHDVDASPDLHNPRLASWKRLRRTGHKRPTLDDHMYILGVEYGSGAVTLTVFDPISSHSLKAVKAWATTATGRIKLISPPHRRRPRQHRQRPPNPQPTPSQLITEAIQLRWSAWPRSLRPTRCSRQCSPASSTATSTT